MKMSTITAEAIEIQGNSNGMFNSFNSNDFKDFSSGMVLQRQIVCGSSLAEGWKGTREEHPKVCELGSTMDPVGFTMVDIRVYHGEYRSTRWIDIMVDIMILRLIKIGFTTIDDDLLPVIAIDDY